jgi:hypothetical protein
MSEQPLSPLADGQPEAPLNEQQLEEVAGGINPQPLPPRTPPPDKS